MAKRLWFSLTFLTVYVTTAFIYVNSEHPVYYWDYKGYWSMFMDYGALLTATPLEGLKKLFQAIALHDYNPLLSALLYPWYRLFGEGRLPYISGIVLFYLFPASWLTVAVFRRIFVANEKITASVYGPVCCMTFLFIPFWGPTLRGLPDIAGIIPVSIAILLVLGRDFSLKPAYRAAITLGLLLWTPFLFRRWYAYTIISLYLTLPWLNFFLYSSDQKNIAIRLKWLLLNFFSAGMASTAAAFILQGRLIRRILATDYAYMYSAYQASLTQSLKVLFAGNGLLLLLLAAWGLWFCLRYQRRSLIIAVFFSANLIISFFLFSRTQTPGIHHLIPFSYWLLLLSLSGLFGIRYYLASYRAGFVAGMLFSVIAGLIFIASLSRLPRPAFAGPLLPCPYAALKLSNLKNYFKLARTVEQLTSSGEKFAVLASSGSLSESLISTLCNRKTDARMVHSSQVDLIDKIRFQAFTTRYLVVADPVQLHLKATGQRTVSIPAGLLLSGQGIGRAYRKLAYDFLLDGGIHAYIYEKQRPFNHSEISDLLHEFYLHYPQWQGEYNHSLEVAMLSARITPGDVWGRFDLIGKNDIMAHPGKNRPTTAAINYPFTGMQVVSLDKKVQGDGVMITIEQPGKKPLCRQIEAGQAVNLDLGDYSGGRIKITIDKLRNLGFDTVLIKPLAQLKPHAEAPSEK
ncbi:MAG: hypothetical protein JXR89_09965 [Deltaproteobacteria bacterium]|nr:hypothetical protein [Deltaproteobacteria bacterium]